MTTCGHEIDSRRTSDDRAKVTCLTCAGMLRRDVRAALADAWPGSVTSV